MNEMPYTLPTGQVKLSDIMNKDLGDSDVTIEVKKGKQRLTSTINGSTLTSKIVEGIPLNVTVGEFKDIPKTHWAYNDIKTAVSKGFIRPVAADKFGIKKDIKSYTGELIRDLSLNVYDVMYGLNAVLLSNGLYTDNQSVSRVTTELLTKPGEYDPAPESRIDWLNMPYDEMSYVLGFGSNMLGVGIHDVTPMDYIYYNAASLFRKDLSGRASHYGTGVDHTQLASILQKFTYKMNLPVVNDLSEDKYKLFDYTIERNELTGLFGGDGSIHYVVSRGLMAYSGKDSDFIRVKGPVSREQFAVILNRLDRAIKTSGFGK